MLNFCSLYSGSTGNCLLVRSNDTNILIDAGVSQKKILEALSYINIDISEIDAILVTHEHSDHIMSVGNLSKNFNIPVYSNNETWNAMLSQKEKIHPDNQKFFDIEKPFSIGSFTIFPFSIPHDAVNPCGFNFFCDDKKITIATDIGHIDDKLLQHFSQSSFMLLESNYDSEILKYSSYPFKLKQRIAGLNGHLSNSSAGKTISCLVDNGLKEVMLGHLSKENNFPELAYRTVLEELNSKGIKENDILINIADRNKPSKIINI